MRHRLRDIIARAAIISAIAGPGTAQDSQVRLDSINGDTRVTGELMGFDDGVYALKTGFGLFRIPAASVVCSGAACPRPDPEEVTVAVGDRALLEALAGALADFAASRGTEIAEADLDGSARRLALHQSGEKVAEITLQHIPALSARAAQDRVAAGIDIALVAQPNDGQLRDRVLATDAVVALVHPDNPVQAVSPSDLAKVLDGTISDWSGLGGSEAPIDIVKPAPGTLAAGAVTALIGPAQGDPGAAVPPGEVAARVAQSPAALGLTVWSALGDGGRLLGLTGSCGGAVPATAFTIASGSYPLRSAITLRGGAADMPDIARDLAAYLASDEARTRLVGVGGPSAPEVLALPLDQQGDYVVRSIVAARDAAELERIRELFGNIAETRQLSTVYRFDSNGVRGEPEHERLTAALAGLLSGLDAERTEIVLHGFSDELETSRRRVGLSRARAEYVRNLIGAAVPDFAQSIRTAGFEDLAPRSCDRGAAGRSLNRRVEVWIGNAE